jgi:hypothetical protein
MTRLITPKRKGMGLQVKTFTGQSGQNYLVFRTLEGGFHVFVETDAKKAAKDCGARGSNTREHWKSLWITATHL